MLTTAFIIAFTVLFIHATTWEGMINEWVHAVTWDWPPFLKKPVYDCPICMAPWWGFWVYLAVVPVPGFISFKWVHLAVVPVPGFTSFKHVTAMVISLFIAGGINTVLIYIISLAKNEGGSGADAAGDNG